MYNEIDYLKTIIIRPLITQKYSESFLQLRNFTLERNHNTIDELWIREHYPVYTQGQTSIKTQILHNTGNIPVVKSDRGGKVTYHGPGQLIIYFLIDLLRKKYSIRKLIDKIENSVIEFLKNHKIQSNKHTHAPGIYILKKKICSIGLRIRKGCTYHGMSLNVDMDLEPFNNINPCGYPGMQMTQLCDYIQDINIDDTIKQLIPIIVNKFDYNKMIYANN